MVPLLAHPFIPINRSLEYDFDLLRLFEAKPNLITFAYSNYRKLTPSFQLPLLDPGTAPPLLVFRPFVSTSTTRILARGRSEATRARLGFQVAREMARSYNSPSASFHPSSHAARSHKVRGASALLIPLIRS